MAALGKPWQASLATYTGNFYQMIDMESEHVNGNFLIMMNKVMTSNGLMITKKNRHCTAVDEGFDRIYVLGGHDSSYTRREVYYYTVSANTWTYHR